MKIAGIPEYNKGVFYADAAGYDQILRAESDWAKYQSKYLYVPIFPPIGRIMFEGGGFPRPESHRTAKFRRGQFVLHGWLCEDDGET